MKLSTQFLPTPISQISGKILPGFCKSLKLKCISEIGWQDTPLFLSNINKFGGMSQSQYKISWNPENAAGSSSLATIELLNSEKRNFLIDVGWNQNYMRKCFEREGIDKMFKENQIDFIYITHEHIDHFFGLGAALQYNDEIPIVVPKTFSKEAIEFIQGKRNFEIAGAENRTPHKGKIYFTEPGVPLKLYEGCVSVCFDVKINLEIEGEHSLFFNLKDKGIVGVTGCCHEGVIDFLNFAKEKINEKILGIYGGLHIAPFGEVDKEKEKVIEKIKDFGMEKIGCNHCTGLEAVKKMVDIGLPILKGTGNYGSKSEKYIGNGDTIEF